MTPPSSPRVREIAEGLSEDEQGYPHLKALGLWALKAFVGSVAVALFGAFQYERGFHAGADVVLCVLQTEAGDRPAPDPGTACRRVDDQVHIHLETNHGS